MVAEICPFQGFRAPQCTKNQEVHRSTHIFNKTKTFSHRRTQNVSFCSKRSLKCSFVHLCTSTPRPWVADPHSTSWDNDQGCGHSDAATCFPIPQRLGRPLCRAGKAVYHLLIFSIFAARCCLATEAESERKVQTGSNQAQNHHGWPFCRLASRELIAGHHILLGGAPKKGGAIFVSARGNFFYQVSGRHKKNGTIGRSPLPIKCVLSLVHPEPIIGCRDIPISTFRGTTEHQKPRKCTKVHTLLKKGTTFSISAQ